MFAGGKDSYEKNTYTKMKRILLSILMGCLFSSTYASDDEYPIRIDGKFQMTINSIKDDEFEVDEDGVWLNNSEITATIHLNSDSILYYIFSDSWFSITKFSKLDILENYGDSVKITLRSGMGLNCDDVLQMVINYGDLYNTSEWKNLISDEFKIIDYVTNKECIKAYKAGTSISLPDASDDNKGKQGIFDLSGRRLAAPPSKGIYIRNGKKVIAGGSR